jgi:cysteine-rich repeat protein
MTIIFKKCYHSKIIMKGKKLSLILGVLALSLFLVSFVSATSQDSCVEENYVSDWLDINDYKNFNSGDSAIYEGHWYIDSATGILGIKTQDLPYDGEYTFKFKYGIGTGNDLYNENFEVVCGGVAHEFPDSIFTNTPQILEASVTCDFTEGWNEVEFKSKDMGSVHLYDFKIEGEKECQEENSCPLDSDDYDKVIIIDQKLVSNQEWQDYKYSSDKIPVSLSPGKYSITLVAKDSFSGRESDSQPNEQYYVSFLKGNSQVAFTQPTWDLGDYVETYTLIQTVATNLNLPYGADSIKAIHAKYNEIPTGTQNSLTAVCVGIKKVGETCSDKDNDGVCDKDDNCKFIWNPNQADSDNDGKGNVCDAPVCGNGYLETQNWGGQKKEQCDDGNLINGDGCSATCQIEENPPEEPFCGDNVVNQASEECDGESDCTSECKWETPENPEEPEKDKKSNGNIVPYSECLPNWECSGWSECSNGVMTRTCEDTNRCAFVINEPALVNGCNAPVIEESKVSNNMNNLWFFIGVILLIILLIVLINMRK